MPAELPPESSESMTLGSGSGFALNPLASSSRKPKLANPELEENDSRSDSLQLGDTEQQDAPQQDTGAGESTQLEKTQRVASAVKKSSKSDEDLSESMGPSISDSGLSESGQSNPSLGASGSQSRSGRRRKPRSRRSPSKSGQGAAENTFGVCETVNDPSGLDELLEFAGSSYARVEQIGQGGWGTVDRVLDKQLEREVAVKRILGNAAIDEQTRRAFIREAKITSQLQHPGIVPVHEIGREQNGDIFYVMKLLEGSTLRAFIQEKHQELAQQSSLTRYGHQEAIRPVLERFVGVCDAVAFAHQRGIVHCDIKPANVMIGAFGETTVVDWGLARRTSGEPALPTFEVNQPQRPTRVDQGQGNGTSAEISGTPAYMAPEQARGEAVTSKSDIYSLGVSLYEIAVGTHPYRGQSDVNLVLDQVRSGPTVNPHVECATCPKALAAIIIKATAPSPVERYATVQELACELRRFLAGQKVEAYQETWFEAASRWCQKNQSLAATLAASVVVLLGVSLIASVMIAQAHSAEKVARKRAQAASAEATKRLTAARESADTWLVDLSSALEFYPGLHSLRERLVTQGVEDYQLLLEGEVDGSREPNASHGDVQSHIASELERAKCHIRLADLFRIQGDQATALVHTRQAKSKLKTQLLTFKNESSPEFSEYDFKVHLELCNVAIAELLSAAPVDSSEHVAIDKWRIAQLRLIDKETVYPARSPQHRVANASVRVALARHRLHMKATRENAKHVDCDVHCLVAAKVWSRWLVKQDPSEGNLRLHETVMIDDAKFHESLGDAEAAEASWGELVTFLTRRIEDDGERPELYQSRAYAGIALGNLLANTSQSLLAQAHFRHAIDDLNKAWQLCDADAFYKTNLATARNNLANLLIEAPGQQPEAQQLLESSLATYEQLLRQKPSQDLLARFAESHLSLARMLERTDSEEGQSSSSDYHWQQAKLAFDLLKEHYGLSDQQREFWLECGGSE